MLTAAFTLKYLPKYNWYLKPGSAAFVFIPVFFFIVSKSLHIIYSLTQLC